MFRRASIETRNDGSRDRCRSLLPSAVCELLQIDLRTGLFKLGLELFGISLVHAFLHRLRCAFNEVLRFFQAETRDRADFLMTSFLVANRELDREFGLLFSSGGRGGASGGDSHRSSGGNAPLFFQHLRELSSFEDGQRRKVFDDLIEVCYDFCS
jgi:hypothetical protein